MRRKAYRRAVEGVALWKSGFLGPPCLSDQESGFRFGAGAQQEHPDEESSRAGEDTRAPSGL